MAIEIVDFPSNSMVIFHSYVTNYQRVRFSASNPAFLFSRLCLAIQEGTSFEMLPPKLDLGEHRIGTTWDNYRAWLVVSTPQLG